MVHAIAAFGFLALAGVATMLVGVMLADRRGAIAAALGLATPIRTQRVARRVRVRSSARAVSFEAALRRAA